MGRTVRRQRRHRTKTASHASLARKQKHLALDKEHEQLEVTKAQYQAELDKIEKTKAHIENMKLRKNKARYKRLKENAYERIYNVGLKFNQPSADDLKKIRKSIFEDMRMEKRKRSSSLTWDMK